MVNAQNLFKHKRVVIIVAATLLVLLLIFMTLNMQFRNTTNRIENYSLKYAQAKCIKEFSENECRDLSVEVREPQWNSNFWIVYIRNPKGNYSASMRVESKWFSEPHVLDYSVDS